MSLFALVKSWIQPRKTPPIVDLLTRYAPVQDAIFAQLDIADVISLSKTTKPFMGFVKLVERTQFNINDRLKHFVTSPIEFRALQARHNILIEGNFAYEFMARKSVVKTGDKYGLYSLLVQKGPNADALRTFLERDGYVRLDTPTPEDREVSKLRITMCRVSSDRDCSEINIVETEKTPVLGALLPSATSLSNFITWNRVYSVFPYETFIEKRAYLLRHPADVTTSEWVDAQSLGPDVFPMKLEDALVEKAENTLFSQRRVGDARSWIIALNVSQIPSTPSYPDHLADSASFRVTTQNRGSFKHYFVDILIVASLSLKYQYLLPRHMADELGLFFRNLTIVSLHRLPVSLQPQQLVQIFTPRTRIQGMVVRLSSDIDMGQIAGFTPPEGSDWKYHDDEMVRYLKKEYPGLKVGSGL